MDGERRFLPGVGGAHKGVRVHGNRGQIRQYVSEGWRFGTCEAELCRRTHALQEAGKRQRGEWMRYVPLDSVDMLSPGQPLRYREPW